KGSSSLIRVRGGAGMVFIRCPGQGAIGIVTALGVTAVLMGQLGDLAALVVFEPGGMLQGIDDLVKPVGIWPILVVVVMGHVANRIGAGGFEAAIIVIEMLESAAGQAMINHLAKPVVAKGLVSPVRITRLRNAVVPIPVEVGPMVVLVLPRTYVIGIGQV